MLRLYYGRDNQEAIRRLQEAQRGEFKVSTLAVRETVLDEDVLKEIVHLLQKQSIDTVQLDECSAYLNREAVRMVKALGNVNNLILAEPTFLSQFFLDRLLISATRLCNLRIQGQLLYEQIVALSKGLKENKTLRTLDLSSSRLEDFSALSEGLRTNSSLRTIKLRSLGLGDEHISQALGALKDHPCLESVDLSFNHCYHTNHIAHFMEAREYIKEFLFGYQNLWQAQKVDVSALTKALKRNKTVETLCLARNKLNDEDAFLIAEALLENSKVRFLNLRENIFTDYGIVELSTSLKQTVELSEINLAKNPFGEYGYQAILEAARENHTLLEIEVTDDEWIAQHIYFEAALNKGGRRLLRQQPPLSLWPNAFERVNNMNFLGETKHSLNSARSCHRLDVLFCLLKGPALFDGVVCRELELCPMDEY